MSDLLSLHEALWRDGRCYKTLSWEQILEKLNDAPEEDIWKPDFHHFSQN